MFCLNVCYDSRSWCEMLNTVSDVLDEWIKVQRAWLYLQPIFDSADIQKQVCAMRGYYFIVMSIVVFCVS